MIGPSSPYFVVVVSLSRILIFATFMTVASVLPILQAEWRIGAARAGAIVTAFMIAYALSLFLFGWAADRIGTRQAILISALGSAVASMAFGLFARDWLSTFLLYGLIGLCQGGVYTPIIMLFAEHTAPARRGRAMGWLIASTSLGYGFSLLLSGMVLNFGGYRTVFLVCGFLPPLGAAILAACIWNVETSAPVAVARPSLRAAFRGNRDAHLLTAGYVAHSWELLGSWAWMPSFLAAASALAGAGLVEASRFGASSTAIMHLLGAVIAFTMGALSDRLGRRFVLVAVGGGSALLSLTLGWLILIPAGILLVLAAMQSLLAIGDSPVLTTALTEVTEPGSMGAVLAVRALLGFGAGAMAPIAAGFVHDLAVGAALGPTAVWGLTFGSLGIGGALALLCALALRRAVSRPGG
jgi:MFS family permease